MYLYMGTPGSGISIHVPRARDDAISSPTWCVCCAFLSTSPGRGTTSPSIARPTAGANFYPRPPGEGRRKIEFRCSMLQTFLSTSPGRGTTRKAPSFPDALPFLSTSPGRGTTNPTGKLKEHVNISIHVPRARDDQVPSLDTTSLKIFLSTSPGRGTTPRPKASIDRPSYFYPRPPGEGRRRTQ